MNLLVGVGGYPRPLAHRYNPPMADYFLLLAEFATTISVLSALIRFLRWASPPAERIQF